MSKYAPNVTRDVKKLAEELQESFKLTDYEALSLALKAEQNELLRQAFVITSDNNYPSALEAISNAIGRLQ